VIDGHRLDKPLPFLVRGDGCHRELDLVTAAEVDEPVGTVRAEEGAEAVTAEATVVELVQRPDEDDGQLLLEVGHGQAMVTKLPLPPLGAAYDDLLDFGIGPLDRESVGFHALLYVRSGSKVSWILIKLRPVLSYVLGEEP